MVSVGEKKKTRRNAKWDIRYDDTKNMNLKKGKKKVALSRRFFLG